MMIRKPNRLSTPKRWVKNGKKTSHKSMPKIRSRWTRATRENTA